jgi:hypothetical protein
MIDLQKSKAPLQVKTSLREIEVGTEEKLHPYQCI